MGFGSIIEPLEYKLNSPGINLILGKNGRGKSTIFNALTWCIWGKMLKPDAEYKPYPHLNKDKIPTQVEVVFGYGLHEALVVRTEKKLELFINGEYQEQLRNKSDVQEELDKMIGISFNLAKNSIIFGQKLTRLLSEKGEAQKKLFDEAFDASFLNTARENINKELSTSRAEYALLKERYERLKFEFSTTKAARKNVVEFFRNHKEQILQGYIDKIKEAEDKLNIMVSDKPLYEQIVADEQKLAAEIEQINKKLEKVLGLEKRQFKLDMEITQLEAENKGYIEEARQTKMQLASKNPVCPTCNQEVDHKEHRARLNAKILELAIKSMNSIDRITKARTEEQEVTSSLLKYKKLKESKERKNKELEVLMNEGYDQCEYHPEGYKRKLEELKNLKVLLAQESSKEPPTDTYTAKLKNIKKEALEIKPQYRDRAKHLKTLEWLIKDPFSNSGLKAYIFNSMLSQVNDRLALYSKYTGFTMKLNIDLESARKNFECIIHREDKQIEYSDLSGGEAQLADVTLAFAIHDIVSAEGRFNILVMDEIFESLDDNNRDLVMEMLLEKGTHLSLHLITHLKGMTALRTSQVITLVKKNGITRLA